MANKFLDYNGLSHFWDKLKAYFATKSQAVSNITRSGTTFTATKADGTTFTFTQQDNTVPKTSTTPKAPGTATIGSETAYAAGDHVHPLQTTVSGNAGTATTLETARTIDGVSFDGSSDIIHYGVCSTASGTSTKLVSCTGYTLETGSWIAVKFTEGNTAVAADLLLSVNSTRAKPIKYRGSTLSTLDAAGHMVPWPSNSVFLFVYDGESYEIVGQILGNILATEISFENGPYFASDNVEDAIYQIETDFDYKVPTTRKVNGHALSSDVTVTNLDLGQTYGTCSTAAATAAKTVTMSGYLLTTGGVVSIRFENDVPASATLNINGKGAKAIYANNAAIKANVIKAGDIATFIYDGTNYKLISIIGALTPVSIVSNVSLGMLTLYTSGGSNYSTLSAAYINSELSNMVHTDDVGVANGVAPLNSNSKIDATYLPSYVDDVIEAYPVGTTELASNWLSLTASGSALTPETGKIYILMTDSTSYSANSQFRWSGSTYVKMNDGGMSPITNGEIDTLVAS